MEREQGSMNDISKEFNVINITGDCMAMQFEEIVM